MTNEVVVTKEYEGVTSLIFYCPGCKSGHTITVSGGNPWTWDGNRVSPTISPSVLLTMEARPDATEKQREYAASRRCHSFVRNGEIQFLNDSGHALAGHTVHLEPFPADYGV